MNKITDLVNYLKNNGFKKESEMVRNLKQASSSKKYNVDMENPLTGNIIRLSLNIINDANKEGDLNVSFIKGKGGSEKKLKDAKYSEQDISNINKNFPMQAKFFFSIADYLSKEATGPDQSPFHNYYQITGPSKDVIKDILQNVKNPEHFLNLRPDKTMSKDTLSDLSANLKKYKAKVKPTPISSPDPNEYDFDRFLEEHDPFAKNKERNKSINTYDLDIEIPNAGQEQYQFRGHGTKDAIPEQQRRKKKRTDIEPLDIEIPDVGTEQYQFRGHGTQDVIPEYERKKKKMKFRGHGLHEIEDDSIKTQVPSDEFFEQMDKDDKLRQSLIGKRVRNWAIIDDIEIENGVVKSVNITLLEDKYKSNPKRKYTGGKGLKGTVKDINTTHRLNLK